MVILCMNEMHTKYERARGYGYVQIYFLLANSSFTCENISVFTFQYKIDAVYLAFKKFYISKVNKNMQFCIFGYGSSVRGANKTNVNKQKIK